MLLLAGCGGGGQKQTGASGSNGESTQAKGEAGSETAAGSGTEEVSASEAFAFTADEYAKLGEYKKLKVLYPTPTVSDDDMDLEISYLLDEKTQYNEISDRGAKNGDALNIDFKGTIDGKEFDGGSETGYDLTLGDEEFPKDFEKSLKGKKAGETVTFSIVFPKDYDEELGGKTAEFTVKINSIKEVILPEYNDAFIKSATEYETVAAYEEALREKLMQYATQESIYIAGEEALKIAVSNASVSGYPQDLYDACYNSTMQEYQDYADMMDVDVSEIMGEPSEIESEVLSWVNEILVAQAIAAKEGFAIKEETYRKDAEALAAEYDYASYDEFLADYGEIYIRAELIKEKAIRFLYENADVTEVSQDEYYGSSETAELENTEG